MIVYREGARKEQIDSILNKRIDSTKAEALYYWLYQADISDEEKRSVIETLAERPNTVKECTVELLEQYQNYRNLGLSNRDAAVLCGIAEAKFQQWFQGYDIDQELYKQLLHIEISADAYLKHNCLRTIVDSIDTGNVKTAMWLLERRFPNEYGAKQSLSVETTQEVTVTRNLNEEKALQAREQLRQFRKQREESNAYD